MIKAGLNIGNSKISCIVADYKNKKTINVLSIKSIPTNNINKNIIVNYDNLLKEIEQLLLDSEKNSQTKINSLNINLPIIESISKYYSSEIIITNEKINNLHLKKIVNMSEFFENENNYYDLANSIISYEIDDKLVFSSPVGNYAQKIKLNFFKFLVMKKYFDNYSGLIKSLKLNVSNYIPSILSSALSTVTDDEKDLGTICIDLGHSTTSSMIFMNNKFVYADSFLVGSYNITKDIARGLTTTLSSAERLKTLYGSVLFSPSDEHEIIEIPVISDEKNTFKQIKRSDLNAIIKPRVEETLEIVWQKIKQSNFDDKKIKNVILTGGGSQLEGIDDYAKIIFSSNVRVAKPHEFLNLDKEYNKSSFCDIAGSILYEPEDFTVDFLKEKNKKSKKPTFSTFFTWLDQYI